MENIYEESAVKKELTGARNFKAAMIVASVLLLLCTLVCLLVSFGSHSSLWAFIVLIVLIAATVTTFCLRNRLFVEIDFAFYEDELECARIIHNSRRRVIQKVSVKSFEYLRRVSDPQFRYDLSRADKVHRAYVNGMENCVYVAYKDKTEKTNLLIMEITDGLIAKINRIAPATRMKT